LVQKSVIDGQGKPLAQLADELEIMSFIDMSTPEGHLQEENFQLLAKEARQKDTKSMRTYSGMYQWHQYLSPGVSWAEAKSYIREQIAKQMGQAFPWHSCEGCKDGTPMPS
jgi:hypothetical protein